MKIYVAGPLADVATVRAVQSAVVAAGHELTLDRTEDASLVEDYGSQLDVSGESAQEELNAVMAADAVLVIASEHDGRGMFVELGAALARAQRGNSRMSSSWARAGARASSTSTCSTSGKRTPPLRLPLSGQESAAGVDRASGPSVQCARALLRAYLISRGLPMPDGSSACKVAEESIELVEVCSREVPDPQFVNPCHAAVASRLHPAGLASLGHRRSVTLRSVRRTHR